MSDADDDLLRPRGSETIVKEKDDKETWRTSAIADGSPPPWSEGDRVGDFVLEKFLGRGSSGLVYRVRDVKASQRQALKLLMPGSAEDLVRDKCGFRRMRTMQHPGLVRVHRLH